MFEYTGKGQSVPKDVISVRFHPSVVKVDVEAFCRCTDLREVSRRGQQVFPARVFNEGLVTIGEEAFRGCSSLESNITLPSTVADIGKYAFRGCTSLQSVVIPSKIVEIGNFVFFGCKSLRSITIPFSVIEIGCKAFVGCTSLREVALNEGLEKIEEYAFARCKSLQSISFPSSVVKIGYFVFSECKLLKEVVLNEGLVKIGNRAFSDCESLESITIPSSVVEIGRVAFCGCKKLREVVCSGELPKIEYNTFSGCPTRITFPDLSSRLEDIIRAGQADVQNKIQQCINQGDIEWERGGTICIPVEVIRSVEGTRSSIRWGIAQQHICRIVKWIKYYEMKEATTLFELALWKAKMDREEDYIHERDCKKAKIDQVEDDIYEHNRVAYRIEVPGPVKDAILQYVLDL